MSYRLIFNILFAVSISCLLGCEGANEPLDTVIRDWAKSHTGDYSKPVCNMVVGSNAYFVALKGSKAKTGYLLDVGDVIEKPYTYIFSWGFQDGNGNYLIKNKPSKNISKQYVTMNDTVYSESIDITDLNLEGVKKLVVTVITKTFVSKSDVPDNLEDVVMGDSGAKFKLCEVDFTATNRLPKESESIERNQKGQSR